MYIFLLLKNWVIMFRCLLSKKFGVEEHINDMSSYRLSFFEKLVICRGLKFSLPQKVSPAEISYEIKGGRPRRFGRLSSTHENLVVSSTEAALRRRRYSDLSMTTIPEPLSGLVATMLSLGSITSRCSGKEPAFLPRTLGEGRPDTRERRKSSLCYHVSLRD